LNALNFFEDDHAIHADLHARIFIRIKINNSINLLNEIQIIEQEFNNSSRQKTTDRETALLSSDDGGYVYFRRGSRARALTRQRLPAIDITCESPLAEKRRGERARGSATGKWQIRKKANGTREEVVE